MLAQKAGQHSASVRLRRLDPIDCEDCVCVGLGRWERARAKKYSRPSDVVKKVDRCGSGRRELRQILTSRCRRINKRPKIYQKERRRRLGTTNSRCVSWTWSATPMVAVGGRLEQALTIKAPEVLGYGFAVGTTLGLGWNLAFDLIAADFSSWTLVSSQMLMTFSVIADSIKMLYEKDYHRADIEASAERVDSLIPCKLCGQSVRMRFGSDLARLGHSKWMTNE